MKYRMRTACLLVAGVMLGGFVSASAWAGHAQYQCLDNRLVRVSADHKLHGRWDFMKARPKLQMPLESRLTCFRSSRAERAT